MIPFLYTEEAGGYDFLVVFFVLAVFFLVIPPAVGWLIGKIKGRKG